jgi:hypothetical protein
MDDTGEDNHTAEGATRNSGSQANATSLSGPSRNNASHENNATPTNGSSGKETSKKKPPRSLRERHAAYKEKELAARAQRQALERRLRGKEMAQKRKDDARQRFLIGTWFLEEVDKSQGRKDFLSDVIKRRTAARDHGIMKDLYKHLTGEDLPMPATPEDADPTLSGQSSSTASPTPDLDSQQ